MSHVYHGCTTRQHQSCLKDIRKVLHQKAWSDWFLFCKINSKLINYLLHVHKYMSVFFICLHFNIDDIWKTDHISYAFYVTFFQFTAFQNMKLFQIFRSEIPYWWYLHSHCLSSVVTSKPKQSNWWLVPRGKSPILKYALKDKPWSLYTCVYISINLINDGKTCYLSIVSCRFYPIAKQL